MKSTRGVQRPHDAQGAPRRALAASLAFMAILLAWAAPAAADQRERADQLNAQLEQTRGQIADIQRRYINRDLLERRYQVETRLNEGRVYFLLKNYDSASILFLDLVYNERIKGTPAHRDALFYLAESLFHLNNLIGARRHYRDLIAAGASGDYFYDATARLIEIATRTGDYAEVEQLYRDASSRAGANISPQLRYVYAKSLFFQERYAEAGAVFGQIPQSGPQSLEALYFLGVCQAKAAALQREKTPGAPPSDKDREAFRPALQPFSRVIELGAQRPEEPGAQRLVELAHMARGRLHYELAEYDQAVAEYQFVTRDSPDFDRALYEITWTHIKNDNLRPAQRVLDILLLSDPDSALAPEASLLRGDLLLRLGEYDDATTTYQELVGRYEPVKTRMGAVLERPDGPKAYFDALVGRGGDTLDKVELPSIVDAWVQEDPQMARTLHVATDLEVGRRDVEESNLIIEELEDVINSRSKIDIFPELKEGWGRGLELDAALVDVNRQLVDLEASLLTSSMDPNARARFQEAHAERERRQQAYAQIPKSRADLASRERVVKQRIEGLNTQLFRLGYDIDSMRAQLVAMSKWIDDMKAAGQAKPQDEATIRESMKQHEDAVLALEQERVKLRRIIQRAAAQTGINDEVAGQEREAKLAFRSSLARERQLLREARGARAQDPALRRIDDAYALLAPQEASLQTYFKDLDQLVSVRVSEIRQQIDVEKSQVAAYDQELESYAGDSDNLVGEIALSNFRRVEEKFTDLILKADIGVIDVAWKRKEDRSERIKGLFELKGNDLKRLDRVFEDVRRQEP